ncbi:MAG: PRC-barrel domain-containing protein [Cyclobacteriaceae bacterium]
MMNTENNKHLQYLSDLSDYKVASDDPDVRGWDVKDVDGRVIGKVNSFLVNKNKGKVRYLEVEVDQSIIEDGHKVYTESSNGKVHEILNGEGENHLIVPIGLASIDRDDQYVKVDDVNHETFAATKRIRSGQEIEPHYELEVLRSYRGRERFPENTVINDQFYENEEFNHRL